MQEVEAAAGVACKCGHGAAAHVAGDILRCTRRGAGRERASSKRTAQRAAAHAPMYFRSRLSIFLGINLPRNTKRLEPSKEPSVPSSDRK